MTNALDNPPPQPQLDSSATVPIPPIDLSHYMFVWRDLASPPSLSLSNPNRP